ncbi:hypothetical protein MTP99_006269 [Tenebrio molitor]|nr:hypothetical protein MTP99_006269 [Tenebrio molitor]
MNTTSRPQDGVELELDELSSRSSRTSLSRFEEENFKNLLPQILATTISAAYQIGLGMSLAFSAIFIPQIQESRDDITLTKTELSWFASVLVLATPIGALLSAVLMEKWGRINALKVSALPGVVGWVLLATAVNFPMLLVGRILLGIASALSTSPAMVYVTEIARKDMRGALLSFGSTFVALGTLLIYLKGWLISWRLIAWLGNIYVIVPFILQFTLPESPLWLISKGRIEEAKKSLQWLHKYQPPLEFQNKSFAEMQLNILIKEDERKKLEAKNCGGGIVREFLKPTAYKPLLLITAVFFFQQCCGTQIVLFYTVTFFEAAGTTIDPYIASILIGGIRIVMSLVVIWLLKTFDKRVLFMISALGMAVATLISGLFTFWVKQGTTRHYWVPVTFLVIYMIFTMMGFLPIPFTMTAEIFPLRIRSGAHGITTFLSHIIMFFAIQYYMVLEAALGGSAGLQWFFSGMSFAGFVFILIFLPETHKKNLSEIEEYFKNNTIYLRRRKKEKVTASGGLDNRNCNRNEIDNLINQ